MVRSDLKIEREGWKGNGGTGNERVSEGNTHRSRRVGNECTEGSSSSGE